MNPFARIWDPFARTGPLKFIECWNAVIGQKKKIVDTLINKLAETKFKLEFYIMSTLINTYIAGGTNFMHPITLLFLFNLGVIAYVVLTYLKKKYINGKWLETIKHLGGLALAVGTIGTLTGLFLAFDALETIKEIVPFQVIMGGLKVALINILYGLIVFIISMFVYVVIKLKTPGNSVTS